jgi:putative hydroxymethylpyrimidine transport system ATP-binding protein
LKSVQSFSILIKADRLAFGQTLLFDNIKFTLKENNWTCLLGPSGVGKTTLLRIVAGLVPNIKNITTECSDNKPLNGRTSYMAQDDLLLPWLSVLDNVLLGFKLRSEAVERSKALNLLQKVGLSDNINDLPTKLSGGMRQRVALVRTIMENRPVVLMDEPFSNLDAISRVRMQDIAADLLGDRTVLLITHDPMEALRLGDRIHILSDRPVKFSNPILPKGTRPRSINDVDLLKEQARLLTRLSTASNLGLR